MTDSIPNPPMTIAEAATAYIACGWVVIPNHPGEKRPVGDGWEKLRITQAEVEAYFPDGCNIGVRTGKPGNNRIDIDLDCETTLQLADIFLPPTSCISGHASNPRSHRWYHVEPAPPYEQFCDTDGNRLLELRSADDSQGVQTLVPPSRHPSGALYTWYKLDDPAPVDAAKLQRAVRRLAAAALLARHYPGEGSRHDHALALGGFLLHNDWTLDDAVNFVVAVAEAAGDSELADRETAVRTTYERLESNEPTTGGPTLRQIVGSAVVDKTTQWLGFTDGQHSVQERIWPDLLPLGAALRPVSKFDSSFLPETLRPLVADVSERMQTPPDFAAAGITVALAGAVNRRARMFPKEKDHTWEVTPNLWGAIVAPPGAMKSPLVEAITKPLTRIETEWRAEYEATLAAYEPIRERQEVLRQAQRDKMKYAIKHDQSAPAIVSGEDDRTPPVQRRLVLTDATFEKLHEILANNPSGVLVLRDELTGWLAGLDRQGRESERAFFLQSWNGDTGFTVDRIGRGSVHVPAVCVSLLGCLQPARIRAYLSDTIVDSAGPQNDGLFQRLQVLVWPDLAPEWIVVDRPPNASALATAENVFRRLANLSDNNPVRLGFSPEAQELFFTWWTDLEKAIRADRLPAMTAHLSKYRSLMPTLAALFELADLAVTGDVSSGPGPTPVTRAHTEQAIGFVNYLWTHAQRTYSCAISPETSTAQELASHIENGELPATFSTRDAYRHHWSGLDTPDKARSALRYLQDLGWVREKRSERGMGRPTETWETNPPCRKMQREPSS